MLIKDIMTKEVKTISPGSTIQKAAEIMTEFKIGCLIVVERTVLVGVMTERDILREVVAKNKAASETKVEEVMSRELTVVGPDTEIEEAARAMTEKKVKRLPVMLDNQIVGIVSSVDIVAAEPKMMEQIAKIVLLPAKNKLAAG
jgi:CBS domain-containing protein